MTEINWACAATVIIETPVTGTTNGLDEGKIVRTTSGPPVSLKLRTTSQHGCVTATTREYFATGMLKETLEGELANSATCDFDTRSVRGTVTGGLS
jgi:hypothetical protein